MSLYRSPSVEDLLLILGPQGHDSKDPRGFHLYQTKSAFHKTASFQIQLKNLSTSVLHDFAYTYMKCFHFSAL
jgi:hypothetical protein